MSWRTSFGVGVLAVVAGVGVAVVEDRKRMKTLAQLCGKSVIELLRLAR